MSALRDVALLGKRDYSAMRNRMESAMTDQADTIHASALPSYLGERYKRWIDRDFADNKA